MALQFKSEDKTREETRLLLPKAEANAERITQLTGIEAMQCPHCIQGKMISVEELMRIDFSAENRFILLQKLFYLIVLKC